MAIVLAIIIAAGCVAMTIWGARMGDPALKPGARAGEKCGHCGTEMNEGASRCGQCRARRVVGPGPGTTVVLGLAWLLSLAPIVGVFQAPIGDLVSYFIWPVPFWGLYLGLAWINRDDVRYVIREDT